MENFQKGLSAACRLSYFEPDRFKIFTFFLKCITRIPVIRNNSNTQVRNFRGKCSLTIFHFFRDPEIPPEPHQDLPKISLEYP